MFQNGRERRAAAVPDPVGAEVAGRRKKTVPDQQPSTRFSVRNRSRPDCVWEPLPGSDGCQLWPCQPPPPPTGSGTAAARQSLPYRNAAAAAFRRERSLNANVKTKMRSEPPRYGCACAATLPNTNGFQLALMCVRSSHAHGLPHRPLDQKHPPNHAHTNSLSAAACAGRVACTQPRTVTLSNR